MTNNSKSKFAFYEIVKVIHSRYEDEDRDPTNRQGYIAGTSTEDNDPTTVLAYGVYLFDFEEVWDVKCQLELPVPTTRIAGSS